MTACTAVRKNCGVLFVALFFVVLAFGWTLLWSVAVMGVWDEVIDENIAITQQPTTNYGYLFLLLLSYFFTEQVIQNTVRHKPTDPSRAPLPTANKCTPMCLNTLYTLMLSTDARDCGWDSGELVVHAGGGRGDWEPLSRHDHIVRVNLLWQPTRCDSQVAAIAGAASPGAGGGDLRVHCGVHFGMSREVSASAVQRRKNDDMSFSNILCNTFSRKYVWHTLSS